jgi:hypothetical protein
MFTRSGGLCNQQVNAHAKSRHSLHACKLPNTSKAGALSRHATYPPFAREKRRTDCCELVNGKRRPTPGETRTRNLQIQ